MIKRRGCAKWIATGMGVMCICLTLSCGGQPSSGDVLLQIDGERKKDEGLDIQVEQFGDIDDDGRPEIIASSPFSRNGHIAVYSGGMGELLYRIESDKGNYLLKCYKVLVDLNDDGVPEIAAPDTWSSRGLWFFSGRDGSPLFKSDERIGCSATAPPRVLAIPDKNGDGTADIAACSGKKGLILISGKDGTTIGEIDLPKDDRGYAYYSGISDVDGDGYDDVVHFYHRGSPIGAKEYKSTVQTWFISTRDFRMIGEPLDISLGQAPKAYACADLNDDGVRDLICSVISGGQPAGTVLVAANGKDGSDLWRINGADIEGGVKTMRVSAKTGEKTMEYTDINFNKIMTLLPDMNGDGVVEIATGHPDLYVKETRKSGRINIISGKDGVILKTIFPPNTNWKIGNSIAPFIDWNFDGTPDMLVGAREFRTEERAKVGSIFIMAM